MSEDICYIHICENKNNNVISGRRFASLVFISVLFNFILVFSCGPARGSGWRVYHGNIMAVSGRSNKCYGYEF